MKQLYLALILLTLYNCNFNLKGADAKPSIIEKPNYKTVIEDVSEALNFLASDALNGRATGTEGIEKAAIYIESKFKKSKVKPYFETYRDNFETEVSIDNKKLEILKGANIVGYIEGNDPTLKNEFVILGAHYDHIAKAKTVDGDSIPNGANDDASGTVAILEWAKYFAKTKSNKRSILFTLYAAEELGLKGSAHLAKRLKSKNLNLYTMINFEMIGVPRATDSIPAYMTGYKKSNLASVLNGNLETEYIGFLAQAKAYNLFMRSDNYSFYKEFKVPAHAISTFDFTNFEYYHHVDDEASVMDLKHMTTFINTMTPALETLINSPSGTVKLTNE